MPELWNNKKFPDGCRNCRTKEKRSVAFGLCYDCAKSPEIRRAAEQDSLGDSKTESSEEDLTETQPPTNERRPGTFGDAEPKSKKKTWGFGKKESSTNNTAPSTKEKAPRGAGRRISVSDTLEDVWQGVGGLAIRANHAPLGRYLQWQSPAAGQLLDEAVSGTIVDRKLLQPAVRARGRLDILIALAGPPGLILAIERNPERAQMLLPALKSALRSSLPTILPAMKKAAAKEEKVNDAIRDLFPDLPPGVDPIDLVIEQLFNGYSFEPPAQDVSSSEEQTASV
jgi:hypothetical protein